MLKRLSCLVVLFLSAVSNLAFAGTGGVVASISSSQPTAVVNLQPGEMYTLTLTANLPPLISTRLASLSLSDPQYTIVGGTCVPGTTSFFNAQTCTVQIRFNGTAPGTFNADLLGACGGLGAPGGYSISCSSTTPGTLGRFSGLGQAIISQAVDTLGAMELALLIGVMLSVGAYTTLRRT